MKQFVTILGISALGFAGCGSSGSPTEPHFLDGSTDFYVAPDVGPRPDVARDLPPRHDLGVDVAAALDMGATEHEPNDDANSAMALSLGVAYTGTINPAGDRDAWTFTAEPGDLFEITLDDLTDAGNPADGTEIVAFVYQPSPSGNLPLVRILDQQVAAPAQMTTHVSRAFFATVAGDYLLLVSTLSNFGCQMTPASCSGGPAFTYSIKVEKKPAPTPFEIAALPATNLTHPLAPGDIHFYKVAAEAGYLAARYPMTTDFAPVVTLWDPIKTEVVAQSPDLGDGHVASTVAQITEAGDYWVIVDNTQLTGTAPAYALNVEQPPPAANDTCAMAPPDVTAGTPADMPIQGWTAANNDVALVSAASGACLVTPVNARMPTTLSGPDLVYGATLAAGQKLAARLDAEFDGALFISTSCEMADTTCLVAVDDTALGETISYTNSGATAQAIFLFVDTPDPYGGYFQLTVKPDPDCVTVHDCMPGATCTDFACTTPPTLMGSPYPAAMAGLMIPDGTAGCAAGPPLTTTFAVPAGTGAVKAVHLFVDITHTYIGDITLDLASPDGTKLRVKQSSISDNGHDLVTDYPDLTMPAEDFASFVGKTADGTWTLTTVDTCAPDVGTLNRAVLFVEKAM